MKIRTRLALGFLLLAIVPLAGIVLYTYVSSLATVRRGLEAEAVGLAREMDERMGSVRSDLQSRLARVAPAVAVAEEGEDGFVFRVLREIAPVAPFVESLEFLPAELPGSVAELGVAGEAPVAGDVPRVAAVPPAPPAPGVAEAPPVPTVEVSAFRRPLRVDVQEILRRAHAAGRRLPPEAELEIAEEVAAAERGAAEIAAAATMAMLFSGQLDEAALEQRIEAFVDQAEAQAKVSFRIAESAHHRAMAEEARRALAEAHGARTGEAEAGFLAHPSLAAEPAAGQEGAPGPAPAGPQVDAPSSAPAADHSVCEVSVPVRENGEVVGYVRASLAPAVLDRLLAQVAAADEDVPFVVDAGGAVHFRDDEAAARLAGLPLDELAGLGSAGRRVVGDWVVATAHDEETGLTFGVARPMGGALAEVRKSAARNFGFGLGFVALAGLAVPALSRRMTRQVGVLTAGAERIARGDLTTRLPVSSDDEIGQLAAAFNHMAHDLSQHQSKLLAEERRRQQHEAEERLLRADHARKSAELEEARAFQLSLLPRTLPAGRGFELAVFTRTAAEVGGDFYDFQLAGDGTLTVAVGDATGHGARAGTMVAVTKSLFAGYSPEAGPAEFLGRAAGAVRRMELGRMAVALLLARLSPPGEGPRRLTVATAGMPPVLVRRAGGGAADEAAVEEVFAPGMPLGGLDTAYAETTVEVAAGDTVLLTTDGFPELADRAGDPLGYGELRRLLATAPSGGPDEIARHLAAAVAARTAGGPPNDDVTFVVVRVG